MSAVDPGPRDPFGSPLDRDPAEWIRAQMWERRTVVLSRTFDDKVATRVAAELMALDADGDDAVFLHVDCSGGTLDAAFTVIDTIDLLGIPVRARCIGRAEGVVAGVLAVAPHRSATPHSRFKLAVPEVSISGRASTVEESAREHQRQMEGFVDRIARATGQPFEHVEADFERGRWLDADEALAYGLIDEIERPDPTERGGDRPRFGFA